jgi:hypothetical protein
LVGFASGEDPLSQRFRDHIGDFHLTPAVVYQAAFPDAAVSPAVPEEG